MLNNKIILLFNIIKININLIKKYIMDNLQQLFDIFNEFASKNGFEDAYAIFKEGDKNQIVNLKTGKSEDFDGVQKTKHDDYEKTPTMKDEDYLCADMYKGKSFEDVKSKIQSYLIAKDYKPYEDENSVGIQIELHSDYYSPSNVEKIKSFLEPYGWKSIKYFVKGDVFRLRLAHTLKIDKEK